MMGCPVLQQRRTKELIGFMQTAKLLTIESTTCDLSRTGLNVEDLKRSFVDNLFYVLGKFPALATQNDYYQAALD
jgi:glycogen phosphorylase